MNHRGFDTRHSEFDTKRRLKHHKIKHIKYDARYEALCIDATHF